MLGIFADFFASIITILLPVFASYKALRTSDPAQLTPWLIYFVILSLFLLVESWTVFIVGWFPFYSWIRLVALSYLVLPQTQGAKLLYANYVEPFIVDHERQIEVLIGDMHEKGTRFGLGYFKKIIDLIQEHVLGLAPTREEQPIPAGAGSYAQSLLSRFAMPSARAGAPTSTSDFYGLISGAFAAATTTRTASGTRSSPINPSSSSSSSSKATVTQPFPPEITTNADKQSFLSSQREKLTVLMRALDHEQRDLDLAYGHHVPDTTIDRERSLEADVESRMTMMMRTTAPAAADEEGIQMGKSRSENSFQNIERHELDDSDDHDHDHDHDRGGGGGGGSHQQKKRASQEAGKKSSGSRASRGVGGGGGWSPGSWFGGGGGTAAADSAEESRGGVAQEVLEAVQGMSSSIDRR